MALQLADDVAVVEAEYAARGVRLIERPGLFGLLWAAGRVTVVSAPAGSGKTFCCVRGFLIGVINVGVIGRSFPAISRLPLVPQLADNVMFGTVFALVLDRSDRQRGERGGIATS
jgi:hypothetical protein